MLFRSLLSSAAQTPSFPEGALSNPSTLKPFALNGFRTLSFYQRRAARIFNNLRTLCVVKLRLNSAPSIASALLCKNAGGVYPPTLSRRFDWSEVPMWPLLRVLCAFVATLRVASVQISANRCKTRPKPCFSAQSRAYRRPRPALCCQLHPLRRDFAPSNRSGNCKLTSPPVVVPLKASARGGIHESSSRNCIFVGILLSGCG